MWTLIGIAIVVVGFALRINPLLVVTVAAVTTGLAGHMALDEILATIGESFVKNRYLSLFILTLPVIGVLERHGLKEQAQRLISRVKAATTGRLLIVYLFVREVAATVGLTSLGGHAQMVRPLIAPMAEGAAENRFGPLPERIRHRIRAYAASADNVGLFFGEDLFIAFGAILLMKGFFEQNGISVEPLDIAVWGIPTAVAAFVIHASRLWWLDRTLRRELNRLSATASATAGALREEAQG